LRSTQFTPTHWFTVCTVHTHGWVTTRSTRLRLVVGLRSHIRLLTHLVTIHWVAPQVTFGTFTVHTHAHVYGSVPHTRTFARFTHTFARTFTVYVTHGLVGSHVTVWFGYTRLHVWFTHPAHSLVVTVPHTHILHTFWVPHTHGCLRSGLGYPSWFGYGLHGFTGFTFGFTHAHVYTHGLLHTVYARLLRLLRLYGLFGLVHTGYVRTVRFPTHNTRYTHVWFGWLHLVHTLVGSALPGALRFAVTVGYRVYVWVYVYAVLRFTRVGSTFTVCSYIAVGTHFGLHTTHTTHTHVYCGLRYTRTPVHGLRIWLRLRTLRCRFTHAHTHAHVWFTTQHHAHTVHGSLGLRTFTFTIYCPRCYAHTRTRRTRTLHTHTVGCGWFAFTTARTTRHHTPHTHTFCCPTRTHGTPLQYTGLHTGCLHTFTGWFTVAHVGCTHTCWFTPVYTGWTVHPTPFFFFFFFFGSTHTHTLHTHTV